MKVGVSAYLYGLPYRDVFPDGPPIGLYAAIATKADELGYESYWMGDHVVFRTEISQTYPYSADHVDRHHYPAMHRYDPWAVFSYLAALTKRIRFGHGVYILPLRNPFVTARGLATLDVLSNGRAMLGLGVGWNREEFQDVGENFENRGQRANEIIQILKALWTQDTVEFQGRYYSFGPVNFEPKPVQKPHPPILVGGNSPAALRRAAKLGDGWDPAPNQATAQPHTLEELKEMLAQIKRMRAEAGREGEPFEVTVGAPMGTSPRATLDNIRRYEEAGITRVTVSPWPMVRPLTAERITESLEQFADEVLSRL